MNKTVWTGRIVSALAILFLLFDGVMHVINPSFVMEASSRLGYPTDMALTIGVIELLCVALYAFPRTSIPGAVLLTGYLGGAVATHLRIRDRLFDTVFPFIIGFLIWGGLWLRDRRLRLLFTETQKG